MSCPTAPSSARRRRGRKWGSRLCALASLPIAAEAYHSVGLAATRKSLGPIHHFPSSSFVDNSPLVCQSSVGSDCGTRRDDSHSVNRMRMSASPCAAAVLTPGSSSSVVPPSSYLSGRGPRRIPGSPPTIASADRYGGRAWGSLGDGLGAGFVEGSLLPPPSGGTLGFVIDDADGIGSTTSARSSSGSSTRLSMVSRIFDDETVLPSENADDAIAGRRSKAAQKANRGTSTVVGGAGIRTVSVATSSPLKKRIAESLLGTSLDELEELSSSLSSSSLSKQRVPAWFPWLPTKDQIHALKGSELKAACSERGLDESGKKETLRIRLQDWTRQQHERRVLDRRVGLSSTTRNAATLRSPLDDMIDQALSPGRSRTSRRPGRGGGGEWTKSPSVDESDLFTRRQELRRSKDSGGEVGTPEADHDEESDIDQSSPFTSTEEDRAALTKLFETAPAKYSNIEINQMYKAAKRADKNGDKRLSRTILAQLLEATPNDSRVVRRIARLEMEAGDMSAAREVLQRAVRRNPGDPHLLQGLANIELKSGDDDKARALYKEAIRADPKLPNAYHALGTLEHSRGNIRVATTLLRAGLKMCPTNHRLHHALGDLYREARMLDVAELAYRRALKHAPDQSKGTESSSFAHAALAFLAYEKGDLALCRKRLHEAVESNGGTHSQGWLALANLEESEGRIDDAREVYREAATRYERSRITRSFVTDHNADGSDNVDEFSLLGPAAKASRSSGRKRIVRPSLSGDKWIFLYQSWARMEEHYGTLESADQVYRRATKVFPGNVGLNLDWARLHAKHGNYKRAQWLFEYSCDRAGTQRADPYRLYAEFEMNQGNFAGARKILYSGAQALSESLDGGMAQSDGLAHLYHTWALCEWHLGQNLDRVEVLFDHALRLTDAGQNGSEIRSLILYSIARFLYDARKEYVLAQHCVCLSLKENFLPGGNSQIWHLWADIAVAMDNEDLSRKCIDQAEKLSKEESDSSAAADLSRLLGLRNSATSDEGDATAASLPIITGPAMQRMLRREPWHHKLAGASSRSKSSWYDGVPFPKLSEKRRSKESSWTGSV